MVENLDDIQDLVAVLASSLNDEEFRIRLQNYYETIFYFFLLWVHFIGIEATCTSFIPSHKLFFYYTVLYFVFVARLDMRNLYIHI